MNEGITMHPLARTLVLGLLLVPLAGVGADDKKDDKPVLSEEEQKVVDLTNEERAREKLPPLKVNAKLLKAARAHTANMAKQDKMAHKLDGKTWGDRARDAGYEFNKCRENVGYTFGGAGAKGMMKWWMESKDHRPNILSKDMTEIGVGAVKGKGGKVYYTQLFATPLTPLVLSKEETLILHDVDEERAKEKLPKLEYEATLVEVARAHAANMAKQKTLAHALDGKTLDDRLEEESYHAAAAREVLFKSEAEAARTVVGEWMKTREGREALAGKAYTEVGAAVARDDKGVYYYVVVLAKPKG